MKKTLQFLLLFVTTGLFAQVQNATFTTNPVAFEENESVTITVSDIDTSIWGVTDVYLWAWYFDAAGNFGGDSPTNGDWTNSDESQKMIDNGDGTFSFTLTPTTFYGVTDISQIGMLVKAKDATGDKKTQDNLVVVGRVNLNVIAPASSTVVINSGDDLPISVNLAFQGSTTPANYEVYLNNVLQASGNGFPTYGTTLTNITQSGTLRIKGTPFGETDFGEQEFTIIIVPTVVEEALPSGSVDGINYSTDATKAILVLSAPGKEFIQVAGSWNNYAPTNSDVMKRDPSSGKYWIELTGLTPGQIETYQYWVFDTNPVTDSPSLVKVSDPFSTLILSSFDDPFIPASTYPNLPAFPNEADFEVSILQTGQTAYNWQVTDFEKPKKEDLIVYEVLVRDFDANKSYQDLINRIDYFKNLNINAIHLMPIMEFEGNESWGYNTSYHMALDKYYGTEDKLKEFIDLCHQNDIAVILDLVLNHAFGRSPMVRMWMSDADGNGFGDPTTENPYFNTTPRHSYNVGYDYNHQNAMVQDYTKRVIKHWVEDFKIDGFRWDLTKGFTQNCTASDENCTNAYQQDRVDVLKEYADYSWSLDDDHYVIFEHLGTDNEEQQWANHRVGEGKGIMLWGKMTDQFNELTMGQTGNKNINRMGHQSRGFNAPRLMGYPESHDEERLMYKNLAFGNTSNASHNVQDLNTALSRMSALGAISVMVPGPKMIWHFGDLGMENSIFTCNNGTVNLPGDGDGPGDCKLDTKPQPQWTNSWLTDAIRSEIYEDWSKLHKLKTDEPVFEGDYTITSGNFTPRIDVFDGSIPTSELRNVIILANFDVTAQTVNTNFPSGVTTTWYDLMDETGNTTIDNATTSISIPAGQFRILGNKASDVLNINDNAFSSFSIYPNPANTSFNINENVSNIEIYDLTGKRVKAFNGAFTTTDTFDISNLNTGMYIVKVENNNQTMTTKLVKL